jgi:hypothetical protein
MLLQKAKGLWVFRKLPADLNRFPLPWKTFEGKGFWKSLEILNWLNPPFSVDLLVRRPDDTERRYRQGDPLVREAIDCGKVLYERGC